MCGTDNRLSEEGILDTSKNYHIRLASGAIVTFGSPEALRESLEVHWPAGHYDVHEGPSSGLPHGHARRRWGSAIKEADGTVKMAPERN
jgi:hypothetical protein